MGAAADTLKDSPAIKKVAKTTAKLEREGGEKIGRFLYATYQEVSKDVSSFFGGGSDAEEKSAETKKIKK